MLPKTTTTRKQLLIILKPEYCETRHLGMSGLIMAMKMSRLEDNACKKLGRVGSRKHKESVLLPFCLQSKTLEHRQHIQYAQASFTVFSSVPQFNTSFFTFHKPPAKMQLSTPLLLSLLTILSTLHPTIAYLIAASTFSGSGCTGNLMGSIDFECSIGDVCNGCVNSTCAASIVIAGLSGDDVIALCCSQCSTCDYNDDCTSTIASACLALDGAHGGWGDITMV